MLKIENKKLFVITSFIIATIDILFIFMNQKFAEEAFQASLEDKAISLRANFNTQLEQTYNNMLSIATYIANDERIQQTFLLGKQAVEAEGGGKGGESAATYRRQLQGLVANNWQKVQQNFDTRQLHFHLGPGSTSFLRVHKPMKFGDNMDNVRFTVVDVNKLHKPAVGFETGRVYSGLRGVVPVSALDPQLKLEVHVGALEVGTAFNSVINILDNNSAFNIGVLLTEEHVQSAMWPQEIERRFAGKHLCKYVIEAGSDRIFSKIIRAACSQGITFQGDNTQVITIEQGTYAISHFPLIDYKGTVDDSRVSVGSVVFWQNIDAQYAALKNTQLFNIIYAVAGFIFIEIMLYFVLKVVTSRLNDIIFERSRQLSITQERLARAQRVAQVGIWEWDIHKDQLECNINWERVLGLKVADTELLSSAALVAFIHPGDVNLLRKELISVLKSEVVKLDMDVRIKNHADEWVWTHIEGQVTERDAYGRSTRMGGSVVDISNRKRNELEIYRLASTDYLTGLYNRSAFNQKLNELMVLAKRTNQIFALMMLDLDGFKPVNDKFGHAVGDKLLQHVAQELMSITRESDIIARAGGDEFTLLLPTISDQSGCIRCAEKILAALNNPVVIDGNEIVIGASIGYFLYSDSSVSHEQAMVNVDRAMYRAKENGKNTYAVYPAVDVM